MVPSMSKKGPEERDTVGFGNDFEGSESGSSCGFSLIAQDGDEASENVDVLEKPQRSSREDFYVQQALGLCKDTDAKWTDARGQQGPSPADFGDHKPIPVDSVCASIVISEEEE
jgi:hypothetical protein